jgi:hypothetical protein
MFDDENPWWKGHVRRAMNGSRGWGWEAAKEIDERLVVRVWEVGFKRSSFEVIPSFIARRRDRG